MGTAAKTQNLEELTSANLPGEVTLNAIQLSDVFFNSVCDEYQTAVEDNLSDVDVRQAIEKDARAFCSMIGVPESFASAFADDFLGRL